MYAARFARSTPRFAAQLRAPAQRRFASGSAQNQFISERQHIKEHAKESTGKSTAPWRSQLTLAEQGLTFLRAVEEDFHLVRCPMPTETTERIPSWLSSRCRALPPEEQLLE